MPELDSLFRSNEIARRLGVSRAVVSNWKARYTDFPLPADVQDEIERWNWTDVEDFLHRHGLPHKASPRTPSQWELLRNGKQYGIYPTRARARVALISVLAAEGETGLRLADAVLTTASIEEVDLNGITFAVRCLRRKGRQRRISADDLS